MGDVSYPPDAEGSKRTLQPASGSGHNLAARDRHYDADLGQKVACFGSLKEGNAPWISTMKQRIDPVNEHETAWIKTQLENASKFVEGFSKEDPEKPLTLAALDRAFAAWIASEPTETDLINAVINYVGIAFGQSLVDGIGLKWVIATDDQGSELAVHGFPGRGDVLVYPANFVAKRWERRETNFLEKAYQQIGQDIRAVFRNWQRSLGS